MKSPITGSVWKFGKDIDTDQIYPGRYLELTDPAAIASHAMEGVDPNFAAAFRPGDIIVADKNFGAGSSREHAAICLKYLGTSCIIAESFARIFFRNAINLGLPVLICPGIYDMVRQGDILEVDIGTGMITNLRISEQIQGQPLPADILAIIEAGGIISYFTNQG